jgi:hypothetical protein
MTQNTFRRFCFEFKKDQQVESAKSYYSKPLNEIHRGINKKNISAIDSTTKIL